MKKQFFQFFQFFRVSSKGLFRNKTGKIEKNWKNCFLCEKVGPGGGCSIYIYISMHTAAVYIHVHAISSWWFQPNSKICSSTWIISPTRGKHQISLKPPPPPSIYSSLRIQTPPNRVGLMVSVPSPGHRIVGTISFLGHTWILRV